MRNALSATLIVCVEQAKLLRKIRALLHKSPHQLNQHGRITATTRQCTAYVNLVKKWEWE
jgi:hypothetical protein